MLAAFVVSVVAICAGLVLGDLLVQAFRLPVRRAALWAAWRARRPMLDSTDYPAFVARKERWLRQRPR